MAVNLRSYAVCQFFVDIALLRHFSEHFQVFVTDVQLLDCVFFVGELILCVVLCEHVVKALDVMGLEYKPVVEVLFA